MVKDLSGCWLKQFGNPGENVEGCRSKEQRKKKNSKCIAKHNKRCSEKCPRNILETYDAERLAKWSSLFTIELLRKKGRSRYPPATIHRILSGSSKICVSSWKSWLYWGLQTCSATPAIAVLSGQGSMITIYCSIPGVVRASSIKSSHQGNLITLDSPKYHKSSNIQIEETHRIGLCTITV